MKVQVHYSAQLRAAAGQTEHDIDLPESSSLAEMLSLLVASGGDNVRPHLIADNGQVRPSLLIVVNNAVVPSSLAASTVLQHGDQILLLPPIAGG
jgi:molybdopterin converting factor small subunit